MATINCAVEGCNTNITVDEAVSKSVRFICKNRPRSVQVRTAGRSYDPVKDNSDQELHFQSHQFDKDLKRGSRPQGTGHIHNQGSDVIDADEIERHLVNGGFRD